MAAYTITCLHFDEDWVNIPISVEAETASKAKYKAFQAYREAFRPQGANPFKWFLDYVILSVVKEV